MSAIANVSAANAVRVDVGPEQLVVWAPFLVIIAIIACAIAASFYVDAPPVDLSFIGS